MKKNLALLFIGLLTVLAKAQSSGIYSTSFGEIKLVEENNQANPAKEETIIYGDYRDLGTLLSTQIKPTQGTPGKIIEGKFMNENNEGRFEWAIFPPRPNEKYQFNGKWGWGNTLNGGVWKGHRIKFYDNANYSLKFANWSGNWDTSFGKIFLKQHGQQVTGDYKDVGTITGTIQGNTVKGTFYNKGSKGSFEFTLQGNTFKGKWGWGNKLDGGQWNGTKTLKTNAESSSTPSNTAETEQRYRLTLDKIYVQSVDDGPEGIFAGYELFGIGWCRAYDATGKQLQPFDVTYADQYGRFWEIKPQNYIKTDMKIGAQYEIGKSITFDFPVQNPSNMNEFLKKSKIELTVELKDYDTASSSDILGKERIVIPLNEASIPRHTSSSMPSSQQKGVIHIKHGKGHLMVTFYIQKL